jgi:hypothetical protein
MSLSERRNADIGIVEGLFITKTLQEQAKSIVASTQKELKGFRSARWNKQTMNVSGDTLTYTHNINFRFLDMKARISKKSKKSYKVQRKSLPVHNKPIFRHKRYIQKRISFGFTDEIRGIFEKLAQEANLLSDQIPKN